MIKHNGECYGWNAVYLISGLVQEDFLHDSVGSWEWFLECLGKSELIEALQKMPQGARVIGYAGILSKIGHFDQTKPTRLT